MLVGSSEIDSKKSTTKNSLQKLMHRSLKMKKKNLHKSEINLKNTDNIFDTKFFM